jgi:hypothetical protein
MIALSVAVMLVGLMDAPLGAQDNTYSWRKPHAKVLPWGDLEYAPEPYRFQPQGQVRYIDFENGDDANPGTRAAPWKHHPWDPNARGVARTAKADTYVFKGGVTYRGTIIVPNDASAVLARDPQWGEGEARIYSSEIVTGWARGAHPKMPESETVWKAEIDFLPRCAWAVSTDGEVIRLNLARTPNWRASNPADPLSEWWEWEQPEWWLQWSNRNKNVTVVGEKKFNLAIDAEHLPKFGESLVGGIVWTEFGCPTGGVPVPMKIHAYDAQRKGVAIGTRWNEREGVYLLRGHRYFLENLPQFLDEGGEFWFERKGRSRGGTFYMRLPDDADPEDYTIEAARYLCAVDAGSGQSIGHIRVSGLAFRFSNINWDYDAPHYLDPDQRTGVICAKGSAESIRVDHCVFEHVNCALTVYPKAPAMEGGDGNRVDTIVFADNRIRYTDHQGVLIDTQEGRRSIRGPFPSIGRIMCLRNKLEQANLRASRGSWSGGLWLKNAEEIHAAGNFLYRIGSAGLQVSLAKGSGEGRDLPYARGLVHHNKVIEALITNSDGGNFQINQNGPVYLWSNVSGNPGGYMHWQNKGSNFHGRFGMAFYFDGNVMKRHMFNNIAWGANNDLGSPLANHSAIQQFMSKNTEIFNNTFYRFMQPLRRQSTLDARSKYISNLVVDISEFAVHDNRPRKDEVNTSHEGKSEDAYDYATLAYKDNVFAGLRGPVGLFESDGTVYDTISDFNAALEKRGALTHDLGVLLEQDPLPGAAQKDFRPIDALAKEPCHRVFVPWALHGVVGEWAFARNNEDPTRLIDEHNYLSSYYLSRAGYHKRPNYPLQGIGIGADRFLKGALETWTDGALTLDGRSQYLVLPQATLAQTLNLPEGGTTITVKPEDQRNVNIADQNLLIEAYLRIDADSGVLVQKMDKRSGYRLRVNDKGMLVFEIRSAGKPMASRVSDTSIGDGQWHHIIAEADRDAPDGLHLYVDGKVADGDMSGVMTDASIYNEGDFLVAGGPGLDHLACTLDFLRVARGTLADAHTTIEELYAWQFDGPFLDDFVGRRRKFPESAPGAIDVTRE